MTSGKRTGVESTAPGLTARVLLAFASLALAGVGSALLYGSRRKKIFVSYDYDNDRRYRFLLAAWSANAAFALSFEDHSTPRINSTQAGPIKRALARKMSGADYVLVIVGRQTHRSDWVRWEIEKAKELRLKLIGVKLNRTYTSPPGLLGANAVWAHSFTAQAISQAVRRA